MEKYKLQPWEIGLCKLMGDRKALSEINLKLLESNERARVTVKEELPGEEMRGEIAEAAKRARKKPLPSELQGLTPPHGFKWTGEYRHPENDEYFTDYTYFNNQPYKCGSNGTHNSAYFKSKGESGKRWICVPV